jgi:hypothetical protein
MKSLHNVVRTFSKCCTKHAVATAHMHDESTFDISLHQKLRTILSESPSSEKQ